LSARGEWQAAFDLLMAAEAGGGLGTPDLSLLGEVAYAAGHLDVTIETWERAHAACMQAGDHLAAAGAAVRVAMHLLFDTALMAPVRGGRRGRSACSRPRTSRRPMRGWRSSAPTSGSSPATPPTPADGLGARS